MNVVNKAKENLVITIAITLAILAGGAAGAVQLWGIMDRTHVTEAELLLYDLKAHTFASGQFTEISGKLDVIETVGQCRWLKSEIRALKDSIYARKRDDADPDYINDLENDLEDLEDTYDTLRCSALLA